MADRAFGMESPQWLIVVQSGKQDLYENLRQSFEYDDRIDVILDRRRGRDRRTPKARAADGERRGIQRRQPPPPTELAFGKNAGFFVIVRQ